ncbi:MAG TPA: hypothetical protein VFV50_02915 [Bdellovibrionales bacterium]|nr:hypothetical protein [Bdellovibrionales bacterium]
MLSWPSPNLSERLAGRWVSVIMLLGTLTRAYGLFDHWKTNDHYNHGGVMIHVWLRCLRSVPFDISWGRLMGICEPDQVEIYRNHSPLFMWPLWGLSYLLGEAEWVARSYYIFFSMCNVFLVYRIARLIWPDRPLNWVLATFFQSFFLSGMYFGSHPENISEITLTFMLVSAYLTLTNRLVSAALICIVAGMTSWVGYFQFAPLLLYAWATQKGLRRIIGVTFAGVAVCALQMAYLRGTFNFWDFVHYKLTNPEYVRPKSSIDTYTLPFRFVENFFKSHSRLLGPLFATLGFYELFFGSARKLWTIKRQKLSELPLDIWAIVLCGFGGLTYLIPGHKYAMVHIFNYVFLMPMWALLCTRVFGALFGSVSNESHAANGAFKVLSRRKPLFVLAAVFLALYPYGIYQSSFAHDVANSLMLSTALIAFLVFAFKAKLTRKALTSLAAFAAFANFSQVMNYRNEADTEYPFCVKAREEYSRTGQPVETTERMTMAKRLLYCRGVPIIYKNQ